MRQKKGREHGKVSSETAEKYTRIAKSFYRDHCNGEMPSPERLSDALLRRAEGDLAYGSWQALKSAITWHQRQGGHSDAVEAIQATHWPDGLPQKTERCGRAKKVSQTDEEKISSEIKRRLDAAKPTSAVLEAVFILASELGCRPCEMPGVKILYDDIVYVPEAKTWDRGDRGAARRLRVPNEHLTRIRHAINILQSEPDCRKHPRKMMARIEKRWSRMITELFPRRQQKNRPTLYAFRHQLGSDLKHEVNSGTRCRLEAAYILGHQATRSIEDYGDPRSSRDRSHIKAVTFVHNTQVRTTHLTPAENAEANHDPLLPQAQILKVEEDEKPARRFESSEVGI